MTVAAPLAAWRALFGESLPLAPRPRFPLAALADAWRGAPPALRHALIASWGLILLSVFVFRIALGLPFVDALYFVVATVTTIGYGDYNLHDASAAVKLFGIALMLVGSTTLALLYSLFTDLVVRARVRQLVGRQGLPASGPQASGSRKTSSTASSQSIDWSRIAPFSAASTVHSSPSTLRWTSSRRPSCDTSTTSRREGMRR